MSQAAAFEALAWALIHFVWQGAAIAALVALALYFLRASSARARYAVCCTGLAVMVVTAAISFAWLYRSFQGPSGQSVQGSPFSRLVGNDHPSALDAITLGDRIESWLAMSQPYLPWIVGAWAALAALMMLRQIASWLILQRILERNGTLLSEQQDRWQSIAKQVGVARSVRYLRTTLVESPATLGWLRPLVLLPVSATTNLTPIQLEALIAHELSHIRRHDYLITLVQACLEALLFYHPAVWWLSRRIDQEREQCCDDNAARITGDPRAYAEALLAIEEMRSTRPRLLLGAGGADLKARIHRLIGIAPENIGHRSQHNAIVAALFSMLFLIGGAQLYASSRAFEAEQRWFAANSFDGDLYHLIGQPGDDTAFIASLEAAVRSADDPAVLDSLVRDTLYGSCPDSVSRRALPRITVTSWTAYQQASDWTLGTTLRRREITIACWQHSLALDAQSDPKAREYARAALLLAAQNRFDLGDIVLRVLIGDASTARIAGIPQADLQRLSRRLRHDNSITSEAWLFINDALKLHKSFASDPMRRPGDSRITKAANLCQRAMNLADQRPRMQWDIANQMQAFAQPMRLLPPTGDPSSPASRWIAQVSQRGHIPSSQPSFHLVGPDRIIRIVPASARLRAPD